VREWGEHHSLTVNGIWRLEYGYEEQNHWPKQDNQDQSNYKGQYQPDDADDQSNNAADQAKSQANYSTKLIKNSNSPIVSSIASRHFGFRVSY
jgi:hypothetical protein